jgi:hypothetical protein
MLEPVQTWPTAGELRKDYLKRQASDDAQQAQIDALNSDFPASSQRPVGPKVPRIG